MKRFIVTENDANQRLDKFLTKAAPNLPQSALYKGIRTKNIKVNGKRAQIAQRLCEGDLVELYVSDDFFRQRQDGMDFLQAPQQLNILYEDDQLLLLDKPVGLLSHADEQEYIDTLIARILRYLYEKGAYVPEREQSFTPALVNRIDRNTGGLVIAAKTAQALRILNQKLKEREIHKDYLCVVCGKPSPPAAVLSGYLKKDAATNSVTVTHLPGSDTKEIRTQYRVLAQRSSCALVEVALLTGRTHQIRAHMASIGHPLLGDGKYGDYAMNNRFHCSKQLLYSFRLRFDFQTDAGELAYLNGKQFQTQDIWFVSAFENGEFD